MDSYHSNRSAGLVQHRFGLHVLIFAVLLFAGAAEAQAPAQVQGGTSLQQLQACMRSNLPPTVYVRQFELQVSDPSGESRTTQAQLSLSFDPAKPGRSSSWKAKVYVDQPAYLKGMAYLLRESAKGTGDGLYVYMPAVRRVRRVSGAVADRPLLGSSLSYAELRQVQTAFGELQPTSLKPSQWQGRKAWIVEFLPTAAQQKPNGATPHYSLIRAWIDAASCVPVQAEFHEDGQMRKLLSAPASALRRSGTYWYLGVAEIQDLRTGIRTQLRAPGLVSAGSLPSSSFDPARFYLPD